MEMLFETFIPINQLVSSNVTMKSVLLFFCFTGLGVLLECRHRITQCAYPCLSVRDKRKVLIQGNQWFYLISLVRWGGDHDDNENNDDHDNNSRSQA